MTKEDIINWWYAPVTNVDPHIYTKEKDGIYQIPKHDLILTKNKDKLIYIWGYPGPDYDEYNLDNYGKTWAFTEEELTNL